MLYKTTRFKSMAAALVELEQFIKSPALLENGKPLKQFGGALPRELVGNWMTCAAANAEEDAGGGNELKTRTNICGTKRGTSYFDFLENARSVHFYW
jgi:hypothetical protein